MTEPMKDFVEGTLRRIAAENRLDALRPAETKKWYEQCVGKIG